MTTKTLLTADEYLAMPSDGPSELVRGEVVEMSPPGARHGVVCGNVYFAVRTWARKTGLGVAFTNDSAVQTEFEPDTVRGADVGYISRERLPHGVPVGKFDRSPDLCVEVLSPSDRWPDVLAKVAEYLAAGVDEVWIVDPEGRWIERHRADTTSQRYAETDELTDIPVLPGFTTTVGEFFADV